jgi:hypothetical protein
VGIRGELRAGLRSGGPFLPLERQGICRGSKNNRRQSRCSVSKLDEHAKKALDKLEDAWCGHRVFWKQIAGFYLDVALRDEASSSHGVLVIDRSIKLLGKYFIFVLFSAQNFLHELVEALEIPSL